MKNLMTYFDDSIKEILKAKMTTQLLKRMTIILLYLLEFKVKEISTILKCSEKTTYRTIGKFKTAGIMNILDKPRSGRKSLLNNEEVLELKKEINALNAEESQDKVVHIDIINSLIEKTKGRKYSRSGIYSFCKKRV